MNWLKRLLFGLRGPCYVGCPIEQDRRYEEARARPVPTFYLGRADDAEALGRYRATLIGEMDKIRATMPPPCGRCPRRRQSRPAGQGHDGQETR